MSDRVSRIVATLEHLRHTYGPPRSIRMGWDALKDYEWAVMIQNMEARRLGIPAAYARGDIRYTGVSVVFDNTLPDHEVAWDTYAIPTPKGYAVTAFVSPGTNPACIPLT